MRGYDPILFDLDGTLTDSGEGIRNSVAYALRRYGVEVADLSVLNCFIGPPLHESFERFLGLPAGEGQRAVEIYREYYRDRGIYENLVYSGIPELLAELTARGKTLAVASSKPEVFVRRVLDHFELSKYFAVIAGADLGGAHCDKAEIIGVALERLDMPGGRPLMAGDREHDILGAHAMGLPAAGVLFGYGSRAELEAAGADYIAETAADLIPIIDPIESGT